MSGAAAHLRDTARARFGARQLIAICVLFSVLFAAQLWVGGERPAFPLVLGVLADAILRGLFWTSAVVVVVELAHRLPFQRQRWLAPLLAHLAVGIGCMIGDALITILHYLLGGRTVDATAIDRILHVTLATRISLYGALLAVGTVLQTRARALQAELRLARAERDATDARLHALSAQLKPHFLFNALNTVAMAVRRADRQEALAVVLDLSALLRSLLRPAGPELVSLSEELELVQRYLSIEQIRFRDRLNVVWRVEPDTGTLAVPRFLLQPIIENALRHGIGRKAEAGVLELRAEVADGRLTISISDDGPGFAPGWTEGVGLRNVRARLKLHYDTDASLRTSNGTRGAAVVLSLPCREAAHQAPDPYATAAPPPLA